MQKEQDKKSNFEDENGDEYKQLFSKASNFMWGKTFKGSLWGGQGSGSGSARGEGDKKKP